MRALALQEFGVMVWETPGPVMVQAWLRPDPVTVRVAEPPARTRDGVAVIDTVGLVHIPGGSAQTPSVLVPEYEYPQESVQELPVQVLVRQELSGVQLGSGSVQAGYVPTWPESAQVGSGTTGGVEHAGYVPTCPKSSQVGFTGVVHAGYVPTWPRSAQVGPGSTGGVGTGGAGQRLSEGIDAEHDPSHPIDPIPYIAHAFSPDQQASPLLATQVGGVVQNGHVPPSGQVGGQPGGSAIHPELQLPPLPQSGTHEHMYPAPEGGHTAAAWSSSPQKLAVAGTRPGTKSAAERTIKAAAI